MLRLIAVVVVVLLLPSVASAQWFLINDVGEITLTNSGAVMMDGLLHPKVFQMSVTASNAAGTSAPMLVNVMVEPQHNPGGCNYLHTPEDQFAWGANRYGHVDYSTCYVLFDCGQ